MYISLPIKLVRERLNLYISPRSMKMLWHACLHACLLVPYYALNLLLRADLDGCSSFVRTERDWSRMEQWYRQEPLARESEVKRCKMIACWWSNLLMHVVVARRKDEEREGRMSVFRSWYSHVKQSTIEWLELRMPAVVSVVNITEGRQIEGNL